MPGNLLYSIWQYLKPAKNIILKDIRSKTGIYQKVTAPLSITTGKETLISGSEIVLGDSRPIIFHHREIYSNYE
jgi:hypothetical protein